MFFQFSLECGELPPEDGGSCFDPPKGRSGSQRTKNVSENRPWYKQPADWFCFLPSRILLHIYRYLQKLVVKNIGAIDPIFWAKKRQWKTRSLNIYWDGSLTICWKVVMKIVQFKIWTLRLSILHKKQIKNLKKCFSSPKM